MLFQYAQIAKDTIRLLRFHPRSTPTDLHLTLEHQARYFEEGAHYTVISYVPEGSESKSVVLNGRTRLVPATVHEALSCIFEHHQTSSRRYWVDALCINQRDEAERREQSRQIARIHSSADEILAWLGPADELTGAAFDAIHKRAESYPYPSILDCSRGTAHHVVPEQRETAAIELLSRRPYLTGAISNLLDEQAHHVLISGKYSCTMELYCHYMKTSLPSGTNTTSGDHRGPLL